MRQKMYRLCSHGVCEDASFFIISDDWPCVECGGLGGEWRLVGGGIKSGRIVKQTTLFGWTEFSIEGGGGVALIPPHLLQPANKAFSTPDSPRADKEFLL